MCGFIVGTLCLLAFYKLARRGRGCHGRHHRHGPWGGWGPGHHPGERWMLRMIFERLDTTPGQEKVIAHAFEQARDAMRAAARAVRDSREDVARALRADVLDEQALAAARSRHEEALRGAHDAATASLRATHEALDPRQRALLADLLSDGPWGRSGWRGGFGPQGPYRSA
jgi:Spy/CpxP family protein refolding chaperone